MSDDCERANCRFEPLHRFERLFPTVRVDDFMFMGTVDAANGPRTVVIHEYKHCATRRYLHLDDGGHAYRYANRTFALVPIPDAIAHLDLDGPYNYYR